MFLASVPGEGTEKIAGPGFGIVGFQLLHHGTLAETDLGLIEFGKSAPGR
ncbi:MAG: hypothetical protein NTV93_06475 [Verrucomicrobia bacterium]|nr:hypothetical protein [Verrucomicrobiota bacterium]